LVISPDFITVAGQPISFTDPSKNPFLEVGWTLTRDFANIIIVLALVVIGLGTALRLAGYQAQKALPGLILIALLINFTPVICGLIVDAANILMNFFVEEGFSAGNSFVNLAVSQWSNIGSLAGGLKLWDPIASNEAIAASTASLMIVAFTLMASLVYLLFSVLFTLRYIAIWILVILSPLAFACYILPNTRKIWDQWWQQFIQWSFIGVVAAFFLYLADHMLYATQEILFETAKDVGSAPGLSQIFNNIMPYGIVLAFLFIGLMLSMSSSAAGAKQIVSLAKQSGKTVGTWAGRQGKAFVRDKTPEGVRRWGERQAAAKKWGEGEKGAKGALKRAVSDPLTRVRRGMGGLVVSGFNEKLDTAKNYENAKKQDVSGNLASYRRATSEAEKTGIMKAMVEKGQMNDALDTGKFGKSALTQGEVLKTYEKAVKIGEEETSEGMERAMVGNQEIINSFASIRHKNDSKFDEKGLTTEDRDKGYKDYNHKIIAKADTAEKMRQFNKKWHLNDSNMEAFHSSASGNQIQQATILYGKSFSDKFIKGVQDRGVDWYFQQDSITKKMRNPDIPRYLTSSGAQSLGVGLTDVSNNEINKKFIAGRAIEKHPEFMPLYEHHSAIKDAEKHLNRELKKGANADPGAVNNFRVKINDKKASLQNNLNVLFGQKPELEKEWDDLMEKLEQKKQRRRRNP